MQRRRGQLSGTGGQQAGHVHGAALGADSVRGGRSGGQEGGSGQFTPIMTQQDYNRRGSRRGSHGGRGGHHTEGLYPLHQNYGGGGGGGHGGHGTQRGWVRYRPSRGYRGRAGGY
jgi:hypothetical protein